MDLQGSQSSPGARDSGGLSPQRIREVLDLAALEPNVVALKRTPEGRAVLALAGRRGDESIQSDGLLQQLVEAVLVSGIASQHPKAGELMAVAIAKSLQEDADLILRLGSWWDQFRRRSHA